MNQIIKRYISNHNFSEFNARNILILSKISRLQFEKKRNPSLSDKELKNNVFYFKIYHLEEKLSARGSNFDWLKLRHEEHMKYLDNISNVLSSSGFNVRVVTKGEYNVENLEWSDLVLTAGGDGTFLLGASKIFCSKKPIFGINTDPTCSQGHLCIPKQYVFNLNNLVDRIKMNKFQWYYRQRLRVELCQNAIAESSNLQNFGLLTMNPSESNYERRFQEHLSAQTQPDQESRLKFYEDRTIVKDNYPEISSEPFTKEDMSGIQILPVRALNEVFVGEALSARVSYYEISIDDGVKCKQKSSGLTLSTGTGSTSWSFNISGLNTSSILELFHILRKHKPYLENDPDFNSNDFAWNISNEFNGLLAFDPQDRKIAYTVRDPVRNSVFSADIVRGYANKSRMMDAHLVIDGDTTFRFNDGAIASIYLVPEEDQLLCMKF